MAYCRAGMGSDVYMFGSADPEEEDTLIECCACKLLPPEDYIVEPDDPGYQLWVDLKLADGVNPYVSDYQPSMVFKTLEEALEHLLAHQAAGHKVPQDAIDRLQAEIEGREWLDPEFERLLLLERLSAPQSHPFWHFRQKPLDSEPGKV